MTVRIISLGAGLAMGLVLAGCTSYSGGGSYYDPYPYRSGIYYHHYDYYPNYPDRPNRPDRPPTTRPPNRPTTLPAHTGGGRGHGGGRGGGRGGGGRR